MTRMWWRSMLVVLGAAALGTACDDGGMPDAGAMDAGEAMDGGYDAAADEDAGGRCTEFTPEYCPRMYPMDPIPVELLCDAFVDVFCRANGNCCQNPEFVYPAFSNCISDQRQRCEDMMLGYELPMQVMSGNIQYSQASAGYEFARAATRVDECEPISLVDVIMSLYDGQLAYMAPCTETAECMGDSLFCEDHGAGLTCQYGLGDGGLCADNTECVSSSLRCESGMCADRIPNGSACTEDLDCVSGYCENSTCTELNGDNMFCVRDRGAPNRPAFVP
ncbi:MAG: hypothetical protein AB7S26_41125 [Sandaracinaceae bacterium]